MTSTQLDRAIAERFAKWGRFLRSEGATPILMIGLVQPENRFIVTTCEEMPDHLIADALLEVARAIVEGRAEEA